MHMTSPSAQDESLQEVPELPLNSDLAVSALKSRAERDYWIAQLLGWGGLTIVYVLTSAFGDRESLLRFAVAKTFCMATGFGLSHLWRAWLRNHGWLDRNRSFPFRGIAAWLLVMSMIQTCSVLLSDTLFNRSSLLSVPSELPFNLAGLTFLWFVVFMVWTLCYAVALSRRRAVRFELEKLQLEVNVKDAELRALQAQINPHFFFNSLNSIRSLVYEDTEAAAKAIGQLASMMRHNLQSGQAVTARLMDELAAVETYLQMEKLRFESRMQVSLDIAPDLDDVMLPTMVLQTLVENAVKHGVERSVGVCPIRISAKRENANVIITVANQGTLATSSTSTRLGLANASKRLALLFGPQATCSLDEEHGWVIARIVLPQVKATE